MLTPAQLATIESAKRAGRSIRAVARDLNLDRSTVRSVFHGCHPLQRGRKPVEQTQFPVRRFLRAFVDVLGPLGVELESPDEWARYEQIRAMRERARMSPTPETTDDESPDDGEPIDTACGHCGYPLIVEWAYDDDGEKSLVAVADGHIVHACPHCGGSVP